MCAEIISFNAELSPPIYGLPATMQRIIREVSEKRQAAIDFALGPALGAASIVIGSRIVLNAYGYSNRLNLWIMMIGRSWKSRSFVVLCLRRDLSRSSPDFIKNC